jgi:hypothetical protein
VARFRRAPLQHVELNRSIDVVVLNCWLIACGSLDLVRSSTLRVSASFCERNVLNLIHRTTLTRFTGTRPCALKPGPAHATLLSRHFATIPSFRKSIMSTRMMITFRKSLLWIALITLLSTLLDVPVSSAAVLIVPGRVDSMKLLRADVGWATIDSVSFPGGRTGRLFWTSDAGANWKDITPPAQPGARIESVFFLDPPVSLYPTNLLQIRFGIARESGQFSYLAPPETAGFEPRRENFGILSLSRILLGPREMWAELLDCPPGRQAKQSES